MKEAADRWKYILGTAQKMKFSINDFSCKL